MLDNLTRQLDAYHFTNPLSPAEDPRSLEQTCHAYSFYSQCMLSVRHCHQRDPTYLFMQASVGMICDPAYNNSLRASETVQCLAILDRHNAPGNREIQRCLGNFSDIYDISINEITTKSSGSIEMLNAFCQTVFAVMNFAACAEPIFYQSCSIGNSTAAPIALVHALADYALKLGTDGGCVMGDGGGLADLRLPNGQEASASINVAAVTGVLNQQSSIPPSPLGRNTPPVHQQTRFNPESDPSQRVSETASPLYSSGILCYTLL